MSRQKSDTSLVSIIVLTISIVIIISLVNSAIEFRGARSRLVNMEYQMAELEAKRQSLYQQARLVEDPASLELSIRDQLNLAKPGEKVLVVGDQENADQIPNPTPPPPANLPPHLQWWHLLTSRE